MKVLFGKVVSAFTINPYSYDGYGEDVNDYDGYGEDVNDGSGIGRISGQYWEEAMLGMGGCVAIDVIYWREEKLKAFR